jgi:aromatic ring-cleaving dioxygenase
MTWRRSWDPSNKGQIFAILRREILAARLKVTLDDELGRITSPKVKALSQMTLPPIARNPGEHASTVLRREILSARVRVTLDEEMGREPTPKLKALSEMDLPRRVRTEIL